jgi:lactoylglutathione lyase
MKYLHTMLRITNIEDSLNFFCSGLGLIEVRRIEFEDERFTLIFLSAPNDPDAELELTYNWDGDDLKTSSRNFGHIAYKVKNIYETCQKLKDMDVVINYPPKDGYMAFVKSPDNISIELLQEGEKLKPQEPWLSMKAND